MVFEKLKEIFGRVMPQCDPSTITMDSVLTTDLGVDSLNMMLLAITVEDEFKIRFSSECGQDMPACWSSRCDVHRG